jgi:hypothetical protein
MDTRLTGLTILVAMPFCVSPSAKAQYAILEAFPDPVQAAIELKEKQVGAAIGAANAVPFYLIVPALNRWEPGSTVRVAFNGGDDALRSKIEAAAAEWTQPGIANLRLQFRDPKNNAFLVWSEADMNFSAEIRVAFSSGKMGGYWSHVGKDSIDRSLVGGNPNEASLNLDSFDKELPRDWRAIVMHEFGHALGFQHEHQNPVGGCDFRFEDDPGYVPTKNAQGWFTTDSQGRRPGLYTYLGGYSNFWPKAKVDFNLRQLQVSSAYLVGQFDRASIMKYFFGAFMFVKGEDSPCYTASENLVISSADKEGAHKAYPESTAEIASALTLKKSLLNQLLAKPAISSDIQSQWQQQLNAIR